MQNIQEYRHLEHFSSDNLFSGAGNVGWSIRPIPHYLLAVCKQYCLFSNMSVQQLRINTTWLCGYDFYLDNTQAFPDHR